ncbi:MAG TPA: hypothetical protein VIK60_08680 [Vicinamibacterales bacterium]
MAGDSRNTIYLEHERLIAEGIALKRRHEALERTPFDHVEHAAHIKRLHAHLEALHTYLASQPQVQG